MLTWIKVLDEGLSEAHRVFGEYIEPSRRVTAEEAMDRLPGILDNQKFIEAWDELKKGREQWPTTSRTAARKTAAASVSLKIGKSSIGQTSSEFQPSG